MQNIYEKLTIDTAYKQWNHQKTTWVVIRKYFVILTDQGGDRTLSKKRKTNKKVATTQNNMIKIITICGAIFIASTTLTSCGGNSIESDAKKTADLVCKAQKMATEGAAKAASGDMSALTESTELATEAASLATEMQGKYKDASDYQKFTTAYLKALADCN